MADLAKVRTLAAALHRIDQAHLRHDNPHGQYHGYGEALLAALDGREPGAAAEQPAEEMVWLGDLSGYEVDLDDDGEPIVRHRCGWTSEIGDPVRAYLANLLDGPVAGHRRAGCTGAG